MSEQKPIIHIRIRDLRRERSLTQEELAAAVGLSRQSINAMETGRCLPSLPVALQIASFFSVPLHTIFGAPLSPPSSPIQKDQPNQSEDTMSLIPWSPLREMREALDELMDESAQLQLQPQTALPAVNIHQTATEVVAELALPGYQKDNLSIEVGDDFLSVMGEAETSQEDSEYFRREFMRRSFRRTISLPALVQSEKAEAEMKHGILTVRIPKIVEEKPKTARIAIKSAE